MLGILVVSHSASVARGIAEIASGMGGAAVIVRGVGGTEDGELGLSVPYVLEALEALLACCDEVLMVPDLGSSVLGARAARELLGDRGARVLLVDAPVLEGTLMGAVEASLGSSSAQVARVAREARHLRKWAEGADDRS